MKLRLFNTLGAKLEEFRPLKKGRVTIYSCGPTVYDHVHIGNLRSFIFADTLRRVVTANGYKPKHVMNITDVDDKTIRLIKDKSNPIRSLRVQTEKYKELFIRDISAIGIDPADFAAMPRVTDHIDEIQNLIRRIWDSGAAHVSDKASAVRFSTDKYRHTGHKYPRLIPEDVERQSRLRAEDQDSDDNMEDFALWKLARSGEPGWDLEYQGKNFRGRPGWHIECSAISAKYLGVPFDIHTGGIDLAFPHHENEMAQTVAATGRELARYFVHNEHLLVEGKKMSKSLGNFLTLVDITEKGFDPLAFRLLMLQSHYRSQINFTWEALEGAQTFLQNLRRWADLSLQPRRGGAQLHRAEIDTAWERILNSLNDDLGSAVALGELARLADSATAALDKTSAARLDDLLKLADQLLGLSLARRKQLDEGSRRLIAGRDREKDARSYGKADAIRHQLAQRGIGLNDTASGTVWFRIKD